MEQVLFIVEWFLSKQMNLYVGALYLPTNIVMIAFFNYYYTFLQLDPDDVSEQLKRQGASIPLVRPGKSTAAFIKTVIFFNVLDEVCFAHSLVLASCYLPLDFLFNFYSGFLDRLLRMISNCLICQPPSASDQVTSTYRHMYTTRRYVHFEG